ncbi:MAG TPA: plastocyanin/azurin family copper-binding protein [Rudaea sp.]|nr:plastocyanin/azurin family copper-binding protein [Rudaea sp.]
MLKLLFAAALLHMPGSAVQATTFTVTANGNLSFTPSTLTINSGDTVTFKNAGGNHNVVADDNSFTNGAPSTANWSYSRTFNSAGTFGYYCSVHGGPGSGMHGTITVKSVAPPPPTISLGGYLSGNWYVPNQGGHGFQLEFTNLSTGATTFNMLAIWFVYAPVASTANDGSGQNWIYAQGDYDTTKNTVTLPAILLTGARFPPNFNPADVRRVSGDSSTLWGSLTFTFSDCNNGTVSWTSTLPSYGNSSAPLPIQRLSQIAGTTCPP